MAKNTHYVVWVGRNTGIFNDWATTEAQVKGFPGAKFKGFPSEDAAKVAYGMHENKQSTAKANPIPSGVFLTVDAAFSGKTKILEWRGVLVENGKKTEVFRSAAYRGGSANVGEYLALVQGIQYLSNKNMSIPIYSDSLNAQKWIRDKKHSSEAEVSTALKELMDLSDAYLQAGGYAAVKNKIKIIDWETSKWGEIAADFGRKTGRGLSVADGPVL